MHREEKRLSAEYQMPVRSFDFQSDVTTCGAVFSYQRHLTTSSMNNPALS